MSMAIIRVSNRALTVVYLSFDLRFFPGRNTITWFDFFRDLEFLAFYSSILQVKNAVKQIVSFLFHNIFSQNKNKNE